MDIARSLIEELETFSTPSILNGLKRLGLPVEKLETMDRMAIGCQAPGLGARCGLAVTRKIATRRSGPAGGSLQAGPDQGLNAVAGPRFLVVQNVGDWRGPVSCWGELTAHINVALDCRAGVTNGPVRDVPEMEQIGFQTWSSGIGPGGGHVDLLAVNEPVTVGGVIVNSGDLMHGDAHGIVKIPKELAKDLPDSIRAAEAREQKLFAVCRDPDFTLEKLVEAMKQP
jgi:regulator of RNase E activity RraA